MFDVRQITLFHLEKRLSKHKTTIFSKNLGGTWPVAILRGAWVGHGPHRFLLGPLFGPPFFFLISR